MYLSKKGDKIIKKLEILTIFILMINALIGFPLILINALKKSKYLSIFIGIFAFIMGYFFVPSNETYDIYRHYWNFENLTSKESFLAWYSHDYYLQYLILFLRKWKLDSNFLGAISCFLLYYFLVKSFMVLKKYKKLNASNTIFWFVLVILSIPLISFSGLRYYTALAIYIFGVIKLIYERKKIGFLYLLSSSLIHFSMIVILCIALIYFLIQKKINIRSLKILVLICFVIGNLNLIEISKNLVEIINSYGIVYFNSAYIDGKWGANYGMDHNFIGRLMINIRFSLRKIIALYYCFVKIKVNSEKLKKLIFILISYVFLLQKFATPSGRVWAGVFILIILSLVRNIEIKKMKLKEKVAITLILLNVTLLQFLDITGHYLSYFISYGKIINLSIFNIIFQNLK